MVEVLPVSVPDSQIQFDRLVQGEFADRLCRLAKQGGGFTLCGLGFLFFITRLRLAQFSYVCLALADGVGR